MHGLRFGESFTPRSKKAKRLSHQTNLIYSIRSSQKASWATHMTALSEMWYLRIHTREIRSRPTCLLGHSINTGAWNLVTSTYPLWGRSFSASGLRAYPLSTYNDQQTESWLAKSVFCSILSNP